MAEQHESGIHNFLRHHVMVTIFPDGKRVEGNYGEALVWISRHVQTAIHAESVMCGFGTKTIDGSEVIFELRKAL